MARNWLLALGLIGAGSGFGATLGSAADIPVKAPAAVVAMGWSGCYVGGNGGWIGGRDQIDASFATNAFVIPAQAAASRNIYSPNGSGLTGGFQTGCNWQGNRSPFVAGIEADFNGTTLRETDRVAYAERAFPGPPFPITSPAHSETLAKDLTWFSTIRGRAGVAQERWLAYATGGLAIGRVKSSFVSRLANASDDAFFGPTVGSDARTRLGWTVGGGLEYAISNNWTAKVEYLYLDFGKYTYNDSPFHAFDIDVRPREHIVRAGLNYRLDLGR